MCKSIREGITANWGKAQNKERDTFDINEIERDCNRLYNFSTNFAIKLFSKKNLNKYLCSKFKSRVCKI